MNGFVGIDHNIDVPLGGKKSLSPLQFPYISLRSYGNLNPDSMTVLPISCCVWPQHNRATSLLSFSVLVIFFFFFGFSLSLFCHVRRRVEQLRVEVSNLDRAYSKHRGRLAEMVSHPLMWVWPGDLDVGVSW